MGVDLAAHPCTLRHRRPHSSHPCFQLASNGAAVLRGRESRVETILPPCVKLQCSAHFTWICCGLEKVGCTRFSLLIGPRERKTTATRRSYKLLHACAFQRIVGGGAKTKRPPHSHANRARYALMFRQSTRSRLPNQSEVYDENL